MKTAEVIKMFETATFKARHGDVVIVSDPNAPVGDVDMKGVLANGEATGHAHRVTKAKVLATVTNLIQRTLIVGKLTHVDHEEHKKNPIPVGKHRSGIQRQYSPMGWSRVID